MCNDLNVSGISCVGSYRYGFQGQEMDDEIKGEGNSVNYKYRMHDPRVGRFFAVDPLTKKYPHYTPYSFSGNKVIHAVELEGLEEAVLNDGSSIHTGPLDDDATIDKLEESGAWDDDKYVTEWPGGEKGLEPVTIFSFGFVWDDEGNTNPYITVGGGVGADAGFGFDAGAISSTNGKRFN
ncbi:hypothetical protein CW751_14990, partial [Brumimicrobium salinarum]